MSISNIDWDQILGKLAHFASSNEAKEKLLQLGPLPDAVSAKNSFTQISIIRDLLKVHPRPLLESLDLFPLWMRRLEHQGLLKTNELKDIRLFLIEIIELRDLLQKNEYSEWLKDVVSQLLTAEEPLSAIDQIILPSGEIRSDASETLYKLFKEKNDLSSKIQKNLDQLVKTHEMQPILQDKFVTSRSGRWVLPIKSGMQHDFEGIIHAQSHSKQTVFMEPQSIIPLNNRIQQIQVEIEEEIEQLLRQLSNYLYDLKTPIQKAKETLLDFDQLFSKAQLSLVLNAKSIQFSKNHIELKELAHPLLIINNENVVKNNVSLNSEHRILLLSGPNAGGKTVLLKSIGLAVQMARCGLLVCCSEDSRIPFMDKIYTSIGDQQSVDENLSTFAAHLLSLNQSLSASGPQHLILVDEICGSTDPEEGAALARSFIQRFSDNLCFGVITSHLSPLKIGWNKNSGVINGSLEYDKTSGNPSYNFLLGIPGDSLAIKTAMRVGVEKSIIDSALNYLSPESKLYMDRLKEVETLKEQVSELNIRLRQQLTETKSEAQKYKAQIKQFELEKNNLLEKELNSFKQDLDEKIRSARVDSLFKKHEEFEKIKDSLPKIVKGTNTPKEITIDTKDDFDKYFPPGTKVFINSLQRDGITQSATNNRGEVTVMSESMRLSVPWQQLTFPKGIKAHPTKKSSASLAHQVLTDRTLDLRGFSVEDAISEIEIQLDQAVLNQEDRVKIIHGHGTDTLKKSVRSYLSRSPIIKKWAAGQEHTGGDGITWAYL
ncbi:MAG: Smr/MutS family protein [Bdellovibrionales bacterium]|nr:Smr/MutS family protein [Bdellovibrionales bacterium]